ncbi:hypothetical protein ACOMHN_047966 [Nucella lapillus]
MIVFLRVSWMTGQEGRGLASLLVLPASLITALTAMAMAAICTNQEVKAGQFFTAMCSLAGCLGPEFGGAIGVIFSLANAVSSAMYAVGFAESLRGLLEECSYALTGDKLDDIHMIGIPTSVLGLDYA